MIDNGVTCGERLCNFINHRLLRGSVWNDLEDLLDPTGCPTQLIAFFRELAAVTLTGRIVAAGLAINNDYPIDDVTFQKLFTEHLRDVVGIPARFLNELYRASYRAVDAAIHPISPSLQKKKRAWAILRHAD